MARRLSLLLAAAALSAAAAPSALAADEGPASGICVVTGVPGVAQAKVKVGVNIAEASSTATAKSGCGPVGRTVRALARTGAEMPIKVRGFRCTPALNETRIAWRCVYRGGTPRTSVELLFGWRYADS